MTDSTQQPDASAWLSTKDACQRLGVTLRTLYRFIDEGRLTAYQMGRVIRIQEPDLEKFMSSARIEPGTLAHLYPDTRPAATEVIGLDDGTGDADDREAR
ncbi:MAG TPA: helix-turn-helix domain-containing protein [Acidimicrobiales bacterium]|nr:helix-turn-helix domain-containing protein [Acidimicrobiales bacterium]